MPPKSINDFLPAEAETLLALEPEELAGHLLEFLNYQSLQDRSVFLNRYNLVQQSHYSKYPTNYRDRIVEAVTEAWVWLEREGLIAPRPGEENRDKVYVTRRGMKLENSAGLAEYRKASLLPVSLLHPAIKKVYPIFLRSAYETAVFEAFKEVEIAVRNKGKYAPIDTGTDLMRKAFNETTGKLTDLNAPVPERQALAHLFAGAFGYFRNPIGHRNVVILPEETVEMIMLASHLLRIVDSRPQQ